MKFRGWKVISTKNVNKEKLINISEMNRQIVYYPKFLQIILFVPNLQVLAILILKQAEWTFGKTLTPPTTSMVMQLSCPKRPKKIARMKDKEQLKLP